MRLISKILTIVLLISCTPVSKNIEIDNTQKDFNHIIDEIVRYRLNRVSVVQIESMPVYKSIPVDSNYMDSHDYPPPPPPNLIDYSKDFFAAMIERKLIDSIDANFMYSNIDSNIVIVELLGFYEFWFGSTNSVFFYSLVYGLENLGRGISCLDMRFLDYLL